MEEMNDRARASDKCRRENDGDGEKECGFGKKIAPRFGTEIFATDVEERFGRASSGSTMMTIQ